MGANTTGTVCPFKRGSGRSGRGWKKREKDRQLLGENPVMNDRVFKQGFMALVAAFPMSDRRQEKIDEMAQVYWTILKEIPDQEFGDGVRECLAECRFFPTIKEIGTAAIGEETWRNASWRELLDERIIAEHRTIEDKEPRKIEALKEERKRKVDERIEELKMMLATALASNEALKREIQELKMRPRQTLDERRAQLQEQYDILRKQEEKQKALQHQ